MNGGIINGSSYHEHCIDNYGDKVKEYGVYSQRDMKNGYPDAITELLAPDICRHDCLMDYLAPIARSVKIKLSSVCMAQSRHIILSPGQETRVSKDAQRGPRRFCIAHYDRDSGSPGANDNTAAVLQLAEAARQLGKEQDGGWTMVFTDREEAAGSEGARAQGACSLAEALMRGEDRAAEVFIFDACGLGETITVSTTLDRLLLEGNSGESGEARRKLSGLRRRALQAASSIPGQEICLAPTPFSDDAGFLAAGMLAQTITLLPRAEAQTLMATAGRVKPLRKALITRSDTGAEGMKDWKPATWQRFHSPEDSLESLTPSSFKRMVRFVRALCKEGK